MRRTIWTIGMIVGGLLIGLKGTHTVTEMSCSAAVAVIWAGSIGFGFGTIFDQNNPTETLVTYGQLLWAYLQPYSSIVGETVHGVIGFLIGALLGFSIGTARVRMFRR